MEIQWPSVPYPAFLSSLGLALVSSLVLIISQRFDKTDGLLTLSILVVLGTIAATFASMLYNVPQVASTEILIGALATSLGAVVAHWMSK